MLTCKGFTQERHTPMCKRIQHMRRKKGFTLIELIAVIVVLAILAGVALPKYFDYADDAKRSATKGALGGVRAAIANWYANEAITSGTPSYPSFNDLTTQGTVLEEPIPENPYNNSSDVRNANGEYNANNDAQATSGNAGWAYDPSAGKFWANTTDANSNEW